MEKRRDFFTKRKKRDANYDNLYRKKKEKYKLKKRKKKNIEDKDKDTWVSYMY